MRAKHVLVSLCLLFACNGCIKQAVMNSYQKQGEEAKQTATPIVSPLAAPSTKPTVFGFEPWDRALHAYVNTEGKVDYQGLAQNRADLDLFVSHLNAYSPDNAPELFPTPQHKMAYYLNAYNASVFLNVLDKYKKIQETKSVYKIVKPFFYESIFVYGGEKNNLYDLENKLIRPRFKDPRVHFALNCASESCPRLPNEAFLAETLDAQLDRETREFVAETRNVRVEGTTLYLSQIFEFYTQDFVDHEQNNQGDTSSKSAALVSYINRYRAEDQKLPTGKTLSVKFIPYDWTPNDQALKK